MSGEACHGHQRTGVRHIQHGGVSDARTARRAWVLGERWVLQCTEAPLGDTACTPLDGPGSGEIALPWPSPSSPPCPVALHAHVIVPKGHTQNAEGAPCHSAEGALSRTRRCRCDRCGVQLKVDGAHVASCPDGMAGEGEFGNSVCSSCRIAIRPASCLAALSASCTELGYS